MASRVFDRRGRQNWTEEKRVVEDRRLRERRSKKDRRLKQRRQAAPWPEGSGETDQRVSERRGSERRADVDATPSKP